MSECNEGGRGEEPGDVENVELLEFVWILESSRIVKWQRGVTGVDGIIFRKERWKSDVEKFE